MLRSRGISQICHTYSEDMHPIYPPLRCGISYTNCKCKLRVWPFFHHRKIYVYNSDALLPPPSPSAAPPPDVLTGVPVRVGRCGQVSSITCTASVIDNFVATPTFMWRGPGGDIVDSDNILNSPSVMTGGEYTCMACVNVPQVNITNLCTNSTITIQDTSELLVSH